VKTIAFFNNEGGVGKTSLVYHLAWMLVELGHRVMAADLDPQAGLTEMFLDDERLEELWEGGSTTTIYEAVEPLWLVGDVGSATLERVHDQLALLPGDVGLSACEDVLAEGWGRCRQGDPRGYVIVSSLARVLMRSAVEHAADFVLVDTGPNLGAINHAALLGADDIVIPIAADLPSVVGLKSLGTTLRQWRQEWRRSLEARPAELDVELPEGELAVLGYVTQLYTVRQESRAMRSYQRWASRIPSAYREFVLGLRDEASYSVEEDPQCLGVLKNYRSLMSMALGAGKPMFRLTPADGAMGSHGRAVRDAYRDFEQLASAIAKRSGVAH
jgi:chromosome partitioning protein